MCALHVLQCLGDVTLELGHAGAELCAEGVEDVLVPAVILEAHLRLKRAGTVSGDSQYQ